MKFRWGKLLLCSILVFATCEAALFAQEGASTAESTRILLLGDPHLPYKTSEGRSKESEERIIKAKEAMRADVNSWGDVERIVAIGDLVGMRGSEAEYRYAAEFLGQFTAPLVPITGNHDYTYSDAPGPLDILVRGDAASRAQKLERFASYFKLPALQRDERVAGYELVYLCTDSKNLKEEVGLSPESLNWLEECLKRNASRPTIIFYHAPLSGTLLEFGKAASGELVAQPAEEIEAILKRNPQVFLWVSGHTHTPPSNPSFASPRNLYDGRVTDIHCTDLDREHIYTNSLWLYPDHVLVRTYDHLEGKWLSRFDRTIAAPEPASK
jgi:3',5'-cyclic-AMP phosphodiesterase